MVVGFENEIYSCGAEISQQRLQCCLCVSCILYIHCINIHLYECSKWWDWILLYNNNSCITNTILNVNCCIINAITLALRLFSVCLYANSYPIEAKMSPWKRTDACICIFTKDARTAPLFIFDWCSIFKKQQKPDVIYSQTLTVPLLIDMQDKSWWGSVRVVLTPPLFSTI